MRTIYILLGALWLFFACRSGGGEVEQLNHEVMLIHDEVMPRSFQLSEMSRELVELSKQKTDNECIQKLLAASRQLTDSHEGMMIWMRSFEPAFEGNKKEKLNYFKKQKESITRVRETTFDALALGKSLLADPTCE